MLPYICRDNRVIVEAALGPCIVMGDSLAVGVGVFRPECKTIAQVGINSNRYIATRFPRNGVTADTAVISLGINDGVTIGTLENLRTIRARTESRAVYWLLPGENESVRRMIRTVASEHSDHVIDTAPLASPGRLHPNGRGYQIIARETRGEVPAVVELERARPVPQRRATAAHCAAPLRACGRG